MDDADDLIERLLAMAGALLEDASVVALIAGERSTAERVSELVRISGHLQALLGAAAAIQQSTTSA
jgi:hypothetical protein